jgi:hypothetical protein
LTEKMPRYPQTRLGWWYARRVTKNMWKQQLKGATEDGSDDPRTVAIRGMASLMHSEFPHVFPTLDYAALKVERTLKNTGW